MELIRKMARARAAYMTTQLADWAIKRLSTYASPSSIPTPVQICHHINLEAPISTPTASTAIATPSPCFPYIILIIILLVTTFTVLTAPRFCKHALARKASSTHPISVNTTNLTSNHVPERTGPSNNKRRHCTNFTPPTPTPTNGFISNHVTETTDPSNDEPCRGPGTDARLLDALEENSRLRSTLLERDQQLAASRERAEAQAEVIYDRDAQISRLTAALVAKRSEVARLTTCLGNTREDGEKKLQVKELELQKAHDQLANSHAELEQEEERTTKSDRRKDADLQLLRSLLNGSKSTNAGNVKLLVNRDAKISQLQVKCEDQGHRIRSLSSDVNDLDTARKDLQVEVDNMRAKLFDTTNRLSQRTEELRTIRIVSRKERTQLAAEIRLQEQTERQQRAATPPSRLTVPEFYRRSHTRTAGPRSSQEPISTSGPKVRAPASKSYSDLLAALSPYCTPPTTSRHCPLHPLTTTTNTTPPHAHLVPKSAETIDESSSSSDRSVDVTATKNPSVSDLDIETHASPPRCRPFTQQSYHRCSNRNEDDDSRPEATTADTGAFTRSSVSPSDRASAAATYDALRRQLERSPVRPPMYARSSRTPVADVNERASMAVDSVGDPADEQQVVLNEAHVHTHSVEYVSDEERAESVEDAPESSENEVEEFSVEGVESDISIATWARRELAKVLENARTPSAARRASSARPHVPCSPTADTCTLRATEEVPYSKNKEPSPQPQTPPAVRQPFSVNVHTLNGHQSIKHIQPSLASPFRPSCASPDFAGGSWGQPLWKLRASQTSTPLPANVSGAT
ncbi:hypothetical protein FRB93_006702 [Tulasnella sp. JGI-2019a]|nr:hypothetical protein FRB93_006702 [Tulasnella sp. JGI-2019a]